MVRCDHRDPIQEVECHGGLQENAQESCRNASSPNRIGNDWYPDPQSKTLCLGPLMKRSIAYQSPCVAGWLSGAFLWMSVAPGAAHGLQESVFRNDTEVAIRQAHTLLDSVMEANRIPGLSVAVGKGARVVWSQGFGFADLAHGVLVTPLTKFRVGSVSKPFTAAALGACAVENWRPGPDWGQIEHRMA